MRIKVWHKWLSKVSVAVCAFGALCSVSPWFTWGSVYILTFLMVLFMMLRLPLLKREMDGSAVVAVSYVILFAFIYCQIFITPIKTGIYSVVTLILPIALFVLLSESEKRRFLGILINLFSIILFISLVAFLIHFFIDLPYFITKSSNEGYPPFKNYLFFIISESNDLEWFTRFNSIFSEPGHLAMVCAILLYINGYTLKKWQNVIMTIGLFWSLSLAGYVLYVTGLVLFSIFKSKHIMKTIAKLSLMIVLLGMGGIMYYVTNPDSILSVMILSRLEPDENEGIKGNNRNSMTFNFYYDKFHSSNKRFLGIGSTEFGEKFKGTGNSSYKNYVVEKGYIGTIAISLLAIIMLCCYPSKKGTGLLLLLIASFMQRPYFLWAVESLTYIAALSVFANSPMKKISTIKRITLQS